MSPLTLRLVSAAILAPATIAALWLGGWVFYGVIACVFAISVQEWSRLSLLNGRVQWATLAVGIVYVGMACLCAVWLRNHESHGLYVLSYVLFAIWASDSGAYVFGKMIGGPKMAPAISPKKTWAGLVGGCISASIVLVAFDMWLTGQGARFVLTDLPVAAHVLAGILLGVVGQIGDLLVSVLKRRCGLKDTGAIIPGHGGLLDRIDALLLALPVYTLALYAYEVLA